MSSKRVSKKSSRYADYFEPEEIDCKRKRNGDDNEFDDMVPVPEDLADVLKKKTTKQKPKIDCKRKKKDDGDDDKFDDDLVPEPEDLTDVLKKKTTKQKPKGKGVQREKDRNQTISKAEEKRTVQWAAIKAQKMQAKAMFASYKIKASPMMSKGKASNIQFEENRQR